MISDERLAKLVTQPYCPEVVVAIASELLAARAALHLAYDAMRAPIDGWKGEVERKALDAYHAWRAAQEQQT